MSADETAKIVKFSEHMVQVKYSVEFLEEDDLTKAVQMPKPLSKPMYFTQR